MRHNAHLKHRFSIESPAGRIVRDSTAASPERLAAFRVGWCLRTLVIWLFGVAGWSVGQELPLAAVHSDEPIAVSNRWWFEPSQVGGYLGPGHEFVWAQDRLRVWGLGRGYLSSDGRVEFSGQETTFGAEAQVLVDWISVRDSFWVGATCEAHLNQPFDRNLLLDDPTRHSFAANFNVDSFELSQMFVSIGRDAWALDLGKFATPFGRHYGPLFGNALADAPFIRTESIHFRETGLQLRFDPGIWRFSTAILNGSLGRDTNSSKALIARAGFELPEWIGGASVKDQDGIGSEAQKEFNNHVGVDLAWRCGNFMLAGEAIYDQYGLRRPGVSLNDIFWGRSLYNRQLNRGLNQPLDGVGWYINAIWTYPRSRTVIGYGQFHPDSVGDRIHDQTNSRLLAKQTWLLTEHMELYGSAFVENGIDDFAVGHARLGYSVLSGLQFHY